MLFLLGCTNIVLAQDDSEKLPDTVFINKNGYNKFFYDNGVLQSEGEMKNGIPDGYWKNYYTNGVPKSEGNRLNALLDSTWKFYDEEGRWISAID